MAGKLKLQRVINSRLTKFEEKFVQGWTYDMVVESLADEGIAITRNYFAQCLGIARRARDKQPIKPKPAVQAPARTPVLTSSASRTQNEDAKPKSGSLTRTFMLKQLSDDEMFGTQNSPSL